MYFDLNDQEAASFLLSKRFTSRSGEFPQARTDSILVTGYGTLSDEARYITQAVVPYLGTWRTDDGPIKFGNGPAIRPILQSIISCWGVSRWDQVLTII